MLSSLLLTSVTSCLSKPSCCCCCCCCVWWCIAAVWDPPGAVSASRSARQLLRLSFMSRWNISCTWDCVMGTSLHRAPSLHTPQPQHSTGSSGCSTGCRSCSPQQSCDTPSCDALALHYSDDDNPAIDWLPSLNAASPQVYWSMVPIKSLTMGLWCKQCCGRHNTINRYNVLPELGQCGTNVHRRPCTPNAALTAWLMALTETAQALEVQSALGLALATAPWHPLLPATAAAAHTPAGVPAGSGRKLP